jgi:hypothetical protein
MKPRKILTNILNILLSLLLGGAILYWMYRGFDFGRIESALLNETNWWWMAFSLVFGVTAQVFRGLRWRQTLEPMMEYPKKMNCIHAVFISYSTSLVVPRSGEVVRCGVLNRYDGTSFAKAVGTVVTERIVDTILLVLMSLIVFLLQIKTFIRFFDETGTSLTGWLQTFTTTGYLVTAGCVIVTALFLWYAIRRLTVFAKLRKIVNDIKTGIFSLSKVQNKPLYVFYTLGIWGSYFLHFYITFFCFEFTSSLSIMTALLAFVVGGFAVIVPTPNGMGSWHFAVKTVLLLCGVECAADAETYVLIVHAIQTGLLPMLGTFSAICLMMQKPYEQPKPYQPKRPFNPIGIRRP